MANAERRSNNKFQIRLTPEDEEILAREVERRRVVDPSATYSKASILRGLIRSLEPATKTKAKSSKR